LNEIDNEDRSELTQAHKFVERRRSGKKDRKVVEILERMGVNI